MDQITCKEMYMIENCKYNPEFTGYGIGCPNLHGYMIENPCSFFSNCDNCWNQPAEKYKQHD